jgi:hypothetical protein
MPAAICYSPATKLFFLQMAKMQTVASPDIINQ